MKVVILDNPETVADYGLRMFKAQLHEKPDAIFGLATGSTPVALYNALIKAYQNNELSFAAAKTFNLDEYLGLSSEHPQSYRYFMNQSLFNHVDIDLNNTYIPDGNATNPLNACEEYEQLIREAGGIDLQLLGLGRNGHIGFNEPSSCLTSRTRVKTLTLDTIKDNARFFAEGEYQPHLALTMGIGTIMDSRKVVLLATGASKAKAVADMVEGPITASCPASILQMHNKTTLIIDDAAASQLKDADFFKHIETENQALLKAAGIQI